MAEVDHLWGVNMSKVFNPGEKVRFIETYEGVHSKLKNKTLTVLWHHNASESGHPEGRVKLEELKVAIPYHSI